MPTLLPPDNAPDADPSPPLAPRDAALHAIVYRQHLRRKPGASGRRIAGWVGTLLIHLAFLFGMILGPAYDVLPPPPEPEHPDALQVRLIDKPSSASIQPSRPARASSTACLPSFSRAISVSA